MEVLGGLVLSLVVMVLLAALGLTTIFAFGFMAILAMLSNMSFKRVFFVSFAAALIVPLLLAGATYSAFEDGSLQRDLRGELGDVVQLPEDVGDSWREALPKLRELSREREMGNMSDEEAEKRLEEIFGHFNDLQIGIDIDGDGEVSGGESGVSSELPEAVEAGAPQDSGAQ